MDDVFFLLPPHQRAENGGTYDDGKSIPNADHRTFVAYRKMRRPTILDDVIILSGIIFTPAH